MDSNLPRKKSKKIRLLLGILLLVLVFLCAYLAAAGYFSLWIDGMRYVVYDLNRYAYTYKTIEETEPFTISLRDPGSNKGMVVYDGGTCRIEVSGVDAQDGHYRIHFRSYGSYDIDGATLISARKHDIRRGRISSAATSMLPLSALQTIIPIPARLPAPPASIKTAIPSASTFRTKR